ncbi:MAG: dihydrodipicolinate synthase family protein [Synergistaceae bacterium]|nr:dihydrodipicolinate synthase family protein [Synergistaceae bacterium]
MAEKLCGVFAPVPTPFNSDGSLDESGWRKNLRLWSASPLDGIVIAGSNGELPFLSLDERARLTEIAREEAGGRLHIMTGAHFPSTADTKAAARRLAEAGADSLLLLPPHYYKGKDEMLAAYFTDVADSSPLPVFLYNMPANTGVDISVGVICAAARHENVRGIKDTSGDMTKLGYTALRTPERFSVFGGTGNWFLAALSMGACGGTMAVSILFPRSCRMLYEAFMGGRMEEAVALQKRLLPVSDAITRRFGIPGLKAALEARGMTGGPCRRPLLPISEADKAELLGIINASGLDEYEQWRSR